MSKQRSRSSTRHDPGAPGFATMASMNTAHRTATWRLKTRTLEFPVAPAIMGIVNVTPDSFSDGGRFLDHDKAVAHGRQLAADGADILDVGGESTRPYSDPVDIEHELRRVIPVIERLSAEIDLPISIDTSKAEVASSAIAAGAEIINDVTGLEGDPQMIEVARKTGAGICAMHMQGTPQDMQDNPVYDDVVEEVYRYLIERRDWLTGQGIDPARICLDPGIGFGKTHQHNVQLLARIDRFLESGCPILVGHSRKGFIKKFTDDATAERITGTLAVSLHLARAGVHVIRVHDVRETRQGLLMQGAIEEAE